MSFPKKDESVYEVGDLYRDADTGVLFELAAIRHYDEKKLLPNFELPVLCSRFEWDIKSVLPSKNKLDWMVDCEFDKEGRIIFKTGSNNPLEHLGFAVITDWGQLNKIEREVLS